MQQSKPFHFDESFGAHGDWAKSISEISVLAPSSLKPRMMPLDATEKRDLIAKKPSLEIIKQAPPGHQILLREDGSTEDLGPLTDHEIWARLNNFSSGSAIIRIETPLPMMRQSPDKGMKEMPVWVLKCMAYYYDHRSELLKRFVIGDFLAVESHDGGDEIKIKSLGTFSSIHALINSEAHASLLLQCITICLGHEFSREKSIGVHGGGNRLNVVDVTAIIDGRTRLYQDTVFDTGAQVCILPGFFPDNGPYHVGALVSTTGAVSPIVIVPNIQVSVNPLQYRNALLGFHLDDLIIKKLALATSSTVLVADQSVAAQRVIQILSSISKRTLLDDLPKLQQPLLKWLHENEPLPFILEKEFRLAGIVEDGSKVTPLLGNSYISQVWYFAGPDKLISIGDEENVYRVTCRLPKE